jgi:EmrB/QacA subfamily drug resistance transporter
VSVSPRCPALLRPAGTCHAVRCFDFGSYDRYIEAWIAAACSAFPRFHPTRSGTRRIVTSENATSSAVSEQRFATPTVRSIIFGLMVAMFLAALDQTIVATALPTIGREIGDPEDLSWAITAYLLSSTAVTPLYGKLADVYGRRIMLMTAIGIFTVGSVACALAPSMTMLAFARALQGMGGGGLISTSQTIIADLIPPRERTRVQGYFASVFALASVAGPVLGGVLAEHLHWSVIFWINLPFGGLAWLMTSSSLRALPRHDRPHRIDLLGAILMVAASIPLLLALGWGGLRYPWGSSVILVLALVSAVGWALFTLRMILVPEPFLPVSIIANKVIGPAIMTGFFAAGTLIGLTIYVPIYLQIGLGTTASHSGLALMPLAGGIVIGSALSARFMARIRHYKTPSLIGLGAAVCTLAAFAVAPLQLPMPVIIVLLAVIGTGIGSVFSLTTVSIQNAVVPHQTGIATAALNFFRSLGSAIIVAGLGAVVLSGLGVNGGSDISLDAASFHAAREAGHLTGTFRWLFVVTAMILATAFACLYAMEERPLRTHIAQAAARGKAPAGDRPNSPSV